MKKFIKELIPIKWRINIYYRKKRKIGQINKLNQYILIDAPEYGNIGDQAIAVSAFDFIDNYVHLKPSVFYGCDIVNTLSNIKKYITNDNIIILTGGGNMGVEYYYLELIRELVIKSFPKNKIIIFPQTIDFGDLNNKYNKKRLEKAQTIYSKHKNLTICAREKKSYLIMKEIFPDNKIIFIPDIVFLYRINLENINKGNYITFCMRGDLEKAINDSDLDLLVNSVKQQNYEIRFTDTCISYSDFSTIDESRKYVDEKIKELGKSQVVITDRLHGMIFSYIAQTPCIVFSNYNHKIEGVYDWIKECGYIHFVKSVEEALNVLNIMLKNIESTSEVFNKVKESDFQELIQIIQEK